MRATEFLEGCEFPVFFYAGNGCPSGESIAILDDTELPVDLSELEGEVSEGVFEANNLNDGTGLHGWKFSDWNGNTIYKAQLFSDKNIWERQNAEYEAQG
jgi:hypothetical protein